MLIILSLESILKVVSIPISLSLFGDMPQT